MVCRNKGRAETAKDEIVEKSKNQVRNLSVFLKRMAGGNVYLLGVKG